MLPRGGQLFSVTLEKGRSATLDNAPRAGDQGRVDAALVSEPKPHPFLSANRDLILCE